MWLALLFTKRYGVDMAIFNTRRATPQGYASVRASVAASDVKQHVLHNVQPQTVRTKKYSPLGPTRRAGTTRKG